MSEITRTPPVAAGPGKRLYEARVRARLSPEQVAEMLHLSTWQITALEKDDFESLPGPTYVRGYLRNYAQLLGLPADEIIASYAGINGTYRSARLDALAPEPEVTTRDGAVRFATFLVGCILILLAVVWWQGRGDRPGTDSDAPPVTAQGEAVQSQAAGEQSFIQAETSVAPESGASSTTSRASTPTAAAVAAVPAAPAADDAVLGESAPRERPQASAPPTESAARRGTASLVLHARDASWADVRDARGNRLVYTVVPAGRRITLTGTPPFNVFLGNPDGVVLEFNGQRLDAAKFKRGLVARFTVDVSKPSGN